MARLFFAIAALCYCAHAVAKKPANDEPLLHTWHELHMGTVFTIRIWAPASKKTETEKAVASAFIRIAELNQACSDYVADSEIRTLARPPVGEPVSISDTLAGVLIPAKRLAEETGGAFDPTIGPLIRQWRLSRKNNRLPDPAALADARSRSGHEKLMIDADGPKVTLAAEGMQLDLGGIAKGYAADTALAILRDAGFPQSLVAASGDIVVGDPPARKDAWRVGIRGLPQDPGDTAKAEPKLPADLTGLIELNNAAISTSGDLNQSIVIEGVRYSHIVDPKTGLGLTRRRSVTVIAPTAIESDSLATACSVLEKDKALALIRSRGAGYHIRIREFDEDGKLQITDSDHFPSAVDL
jgi:thiamine biosynthesis lipoprotein